MMLRDLLERRMPSAVKPADLEAAAAEGFDTSKVWFHGTGRRFNAFRDSREDGIDELGPGIYVTGHRYVANTWARKGGFILSCLIRKGPLFDMDKIDTREAKDLFVQGYKAKMIEKWGDDGTNDYGELFDYAMQGTRNRYRLINYCMSGTEYVGGFKRHSQIPDQLVVYRIADVRIIAREKGE